MGLLSRLSTFLEQSQSPALEHASAEAPERRERRKPPLRCAGCNQWGGPFVYLSNGRDYCVKCARGLTALYGYRPAGRRAGDITRLD